MDTRIKGYIKENEELLFKTLKELCLIPAPSNFETKRAEYCKNWLEKNGAMGVYIDDSLNAVFPYNCENSNEITVIAAHTDTVFPDMEPLPYREDEENIYCPGVGDDTASVVVLLMTAKFFLENKTEAPKGILFVFNSCEEGLGNLKGTRKIFENYSDRVAQFITFDNAMNHIANRSVGSHRFEVEVKTNGGHSYLDFGNDNAIAELSKLVNKIYKIEVPEIENSKTSYNVGTIEGGTSVNTIAQSAKMLCEYRSDNAECLAIMKNKFNEIFESSNADITVTLVGDRPCMSSDIDIAKVDKMAYTARGIVEKTAGIKVEYHSSSTDCNIPLSLGIPSVCIGVSNWHGIHTREEWIEKKSLPVGLEVGLKLALAFIGKEEN